MCQAKPLPRCSSHAPAMVAVEERKYHRIKNDVQKLQKQVKTLENEARQKGMDEEQIQQAEDKSLWRLSRVRHKLQAQQYIAEEQLKNVWEAELHKDATQAGYKELTQNPLMAGKILRTENATALRVWHKKLRKIRGEDGKSIFAKDGDVWLKTAVMQDEYSTATKKHHEQSFRFETISKEGHKIKEAFDKIYAKENKTSEDNRQMDKLRNDIKVLRNQQLQCHYSLILERAKKNLLESSVDDEFKQKVQKQLA